LAHQHAEAAADHAEKIAEQQREMIEKKQDLRDLAKVYRLLAIEAAEIAALIEVVIRLSGQNYRFVKDPGWIPETRENYCGNKQG
jgi:hypothetical protein